MCPCCNKKVELTFILGEYNGVPFNHNYEIFYYINKDNLLHLDIKSNYEHKEYLVINPVNHDYIINIEEKFKIFISFSCKNCIYTIQTSDLEFKDGKITSIKIFNYNLYINDDFKKDIYYHFNANSNNFEKYYFQIHEIKESPKLGKILFKTSFNHFNILKYNKESLLNKFRTYLAMM